MGHLAWRTGRTGDGQRRTGKGGLVVFKFDRHPGIRDYRIVSHFRSPNVRFPNVRIWPDDLYASRSCVIHLLSQWDGSFCIDFPTSRLCRSCPVSGFTFNRRVVAKSYEGQNPSCTVGYSSHGRDSFRTRSLICYLRLFGKSLQTIDAIILF